MLMFMISVLNMVIMPATSVLFFVRLSAVYSRNKYVMSFFGSFWLITLGIFIFDSIKGLLRCSDIGPSTRCFSLQHQDAWGYMATSIYDTLAYLSISWQLASFAPADRWYDRLKSFATGEGLGWLSKVLLQSGQIYYL
jgi:hypothetical protein